MTREPTNVYVSPPPPDDPGLIDFAGLRNDIGFVLRSPRRHPWLAAACLLFVLVAALASSLVVKDVYQVAATVLAQRNPVMTTLSNPALMRGNDWDVPTRGAKESIIRRENLVAICTKIGMVESWIATRSSLGKARAWFEVVTGGKPESRESMMDALVDTMENKIVVGVGQEGTVTILFEWPDPDIAFKVVDQAVANFLEERHLTEVAVLDETIAILETSAKKLQVEVESGLTTLERLERSRPAAAQRRVIVRPSSTPKDDELSRLQEGVLVKRRALAEAEEIRQRRLADLNAQLMQKQSVYSEQHPELQATRQSIAALTASSPGIELLRRDLRDVESELTRRGGSGDGVTTEVIEPRFTADPEDVRIENARGNLRFVRDQYASVLQRLSSARMELETSQAAFKYRFSVVTPPQMPKGPKKPYLLLRIVGGLLGGAALALFVSTALDLKSARLLEEWQLQRQLDLPLLARINR